MIRPASLVPETAVKGIAFVKNESGPLCERPLERESLNMCGFGSDTTPKRVLIVDDHSIVRRGLTELLGQQPGLRICAAAASGEEALAIVERQTIDLAIVDISLGQMDGIELTREFKQRYPDMLVLILSMHDECLYAERARRAGAAGYVAKQGGGDALLEAISRILRDQGNHQTTDQSQFTHFTSA